MASLITYSHGMQSAENSVVPIEGAALQPLLAPSFMARLLEMYRPADTGRAFQRKHLSILDPLLAHNNLGRSVNKASAQRIPAAFADAAGTLAKIFVKVQQVRNVMDWHSPPWLLTTLQNPVTQC